MEHYVCTGGCDMVSQTSGICKDETCTKAGHALTKCNCKDGLHEEAYSHIEGGEEEEKEEDEELSDDEA